MIQRIFLWFELICLFFILPPVVGSLQMTGPRAPILLVVMLYLFIRSHKVIFQKQIWKFPKDRHLWISAIIISVMISIFIIMYSIFDPYITLLELPKQRPSLWFMIMLLYPLLSVVPQELIWRYHLLEQMKPILPSKQLRIFISSFAFGWMHVVYGHYFSVISTIILGWILCIIYYRSGKSIWPIWFIHAIAGQAVFTFGLGEYFYGGSPLDFF